MNEHITPASEADLSADAFTALGLDPKLTTALTALGYEEPTAIQREAIPPLIAGRDVLGQAATGTGKTAAFALPLLQRIASVPAEQRSLRALILVPTRELAIQVTQAVQRYGAVFNVRALAIYGGQAIREQIRPLQRGVDVVVATPGRAIDHLTRGTLDLKTIEILVLDEADEMLDMGFADELETILAAVPVERQTALFSATMAKRILTITKKHLRKPVHVTIAKETLAPGAAPRVREFAYVVRRQYKAAALARFFAMESPTAAIIFCRTRTEVDELTQTLGAGNHQAEAIHGGLSQEQRDRVLRRFRNGVSRVLVATDVAARGLDIDSVTHVVNYDVPSSPDAYVHRIGRTGRAGREGTALTFAEARELRLLQNIEHHTQRKITIEPVPGAADLRRHRLVALTAALQEALSKGVPESYRAAVAQIAEQHDPLDIAACALSLADASRNGGTTDDVDIPNDTPAHAPRIFKPLGKPPAQGTDVKRKPRTVGKDMARIFMSIGRSSGIRPADLVAIITEKAKIPTRDIGTIDLAERFCLIEVQESKADKIIADLNKTTIRKQKILVRRDKAQL